MKTVGFIDYYLDEFHANHYPQWLKEASGGELEVKYAYGKITSPLTGMTSAQWCQKYGVELVESVEELIAKSDCLNVLSPDNPEMHGELCQLPLRSGKRVYVDKTFSNSRQEAQALFALAEDHGTPCFSASALRFAQELEGVDREQLAGLVSVGSGPLDNYAIHQIEPILALMGPEVRRVMFTGSAALPAALLEFADGRLAHLSHHGWDCPFAMTLDKKDATTQRVEIVSDYFHRFMEEMARFFLGAEPSVPHQDTIAVIAVREALLNASAQPGQWVNL